MKEMPHAIDLEVAVLGGILLSPHEVYNVIDLINEDDFYSQKNGLVYSAIKSNFIDGKAIDLLTIAERLKLDGNLSKVGGAVYIASLTNKVASSANTEYHATIIKEKSLKRKLALKSEEIKRGCFDDSKDIFNLLDDIYFFADNQAKEIESKKSESILEVLDRNNKQRKEKKDFFLSTGFEKYDKILGGGFCEGLHIIAGRPGMGKTSLAIKIAMNVAQYKPVLFISVADMSNEKIAYRCESILSGVPATRLQKNDVYQNEIERIDVAQRKLRKLDLMLDDEFSDILKIRAKAKRLHVEMGISLVIVDYIQQVDGSDDNPRIRIGRISNGLLQLSKELKIPILATAQLSRACEVRGGFKKPQLSDLKESGDIEQDAESVTMLYRHEYYGFTEDENGEPTKDRAIAMIEKNRNGKCADLLLNFDGSSTNFTDFKEVMEFEEELTPF